MARQRDGADRLLAGDGPKPGDPRDPGARPTPTLRDVGWALLAGGLVLVTLVQLVRMVVLAASAERAPTGGGLLLAFLVTVVWLLTIYWLAAGAWRRSVWGCPFAHRQDAPAGRRCPRHASLPADGLRLR